MDPSSWYESYTSSYPILNDVVLLTRKITENAKLIALSSNTRRRESQTSPNWSLNTGRVRCRNGLESVMQLYYQEAQSVCENENSAIENVPDLEQVTFTLEPT